MTDSWCVLKEYSWQLQKVMLDGHNFQTVFSRSLCLIEHKMLKILQLRKQLRVVYYIFEWILFSN